MAEQPAKTDVLGAYQVQQIPASFVIVFETAEETHKLVKLPKDPFNSVCSL